MYTSKIDSEEPCISWTSLYWLGDLYLAGQIKTFMGSRLTLELPADFVITIVPYLFITSVLLSL